MVPRILLFFLEYIPSEVIEMIKPILPPYEVDDMKIWSGNKLGEFEVASAYQRLDKLEVQSSPKDSYFYMGG